MSHTYNLLPGIIECVLCCTTVLIVNGSSGRKVNGYESEPIVKNSAMEAIDVMGRIETLTLSLERPSCHCL